MNTNSRKHQSIQFTRLVRVVSVLLVLLAIAGFSQTPRQALAQSPQSLFLQWGATDLDGNQMLLSAPGPLLWQDDFDGALQPVWTMVNENPGEWSLETNPGYLTIWTSPFPTGGQNLLLREAPAGDFTIQTRQLFQPFENFDFAGLVVWQDSDNFLQLGRAFCDIPDICVGDGIYFDFIRDGTGLDGNFATQVEDTGEAYLRLIRQRASLKAYYSGNGFDWMLIGEHVLPAGFRITGVGLTSAQHYAASDAKPADFDYFALNRVPSPFVGSWQALDIDGGDIRLAIGGPPGGLFHITYTESYLGFCSGEAGIARGVGWLNPDDPLVLEANLILTCFTTGDQVEMHPVWRYDPTTNWLRDRNDDFGGFITTWHRPGDTLPLLWNIFIAHPDQEWVEGMGFPEGTVVSLLIRDSAGVNQFAGTAVAFYPDWDPSNTTVRFELFNDGYDLKAGDQLWMSDGMVVKYHIVTNLQITGVDLPSETVSGIAEPFSEVIIDYSPNPCIEFPFTVTADAEGNWTAIVPCLIPGLDGLADQEDADGDLTRVGFRVPRLDLRVNYGHDWVESFFPAEHAVKITVTDADGNLKASAEVMTAPRDEWGGEEGFQTRPEDWVPGQPDIRPNDWVLAEVVSGPYSAQDSAVQIGDISGMIDLDADSIQGTINAPWFPGEVEVNVECHPWGAPEPTEMRFDTVFPDGSDTYACSWAGEWDIDYYQDVGVGYSGPDGHWVANAFRVLNPHFTIFPLWQWYDGLDWPDGATVSITVEDKPECTFTKESWNYFFNGGFPAGCNVEVDDTVTFTDGNTIRTHIVRNLAITAIDLDEDTISGLADEGTTVYVWPHDAWFEPLQAVANESGVWQVDLGDVDYDIQEGASGRSEIRDDTGNATAVDWSLNPRIIVHTEDDWFRAEGFMPNTELDFQIYDASGGILLLESITAPTDSGGTVTHWVGDQMGIVPGNHVVVSDGTSTRDIVLEDLTFDVFDTTQGILQGMAPAPFGRTVSVGIGCWAREDLGMDVTTDEFGAWIVDFGAPVPNDFGCAFAWVYEADGDASEARPEQIIWWSE
ncbi:MAG TPA: hypothetical protein VLA49_11115 [Anaerolineales bacterium]|nr:hypothetical protein [Anaerolineales bacterium]